MLSDKVYEGTSRGKPVYFVSLDGGEIEITFDKKTLTWKKALDVGSGTDIGGDYYGSRELRQFRENHPGVFEYAAGMLSRHTGRNVPIPQIRYVNARKIKRRK